MALDDSRAGNRSCGCCLALAGSLAPGGRGRHADRRPFDRISRTETCPSFSPDGTQVAFQWCPEGWVTGKNCDIYVKQIGMEQPYPLTDTPEQEYGPAWSPDGRFIAFLQQLSTEKVALVLIPQRRRTPKGAGGTGCF